MTHTGAPSRDYALIVTRNRNLSKTTHFIECHVTCIAYRTRGAHKYMSVSMTWRSKGQWRDYCNSRISVQGKSLLPLEHDFCFLSSTAFNAITRIPFVQWSELLRAISWASEMWQYKEYNRSSQEHVPEYMSVLMPDLRYIE